MEIQLNYLNHYQNTILNTADQSATITNQPIRILRAFEYSFETFSFLNKMSVQSRKG
jgi:hypothetical protein